MENVPLINCAIPKDIMQVVLHKWHQTLSGRQVIEAGALVVEFPLVVVMVESPDRCQVSEAGGASGGGGSHWWVRLPVTRGRLSLPSSQ